MERYAEDLDAMRSRAAVLQDEVAAQLSERSNRALYLLSVVTVLFVPLGFVAGLLGMNVQGIPGSSEPLGFWLVCAVLAAMLAVEIWVIARLDR